MGYLEKKKISHKQRWVKHKSPFGTNFLLRDYWGHKKVMKGLMKYVNK